MSEQATGGAAAKADVVIAAVPYESHASTLRDVEAELGGKVLIYWVNVLTVHEQALWRWWLKGAARPGSRGLMPRTRVVSAFHHGSAKVLLDLDADNEPEDVLICRDAGASGWCSRWRPRWPQARGST